MEVLPHLSLLLLVTAAAATGFSVNDLYLRKDLATFCPSNGGKLEVKLGTRAAVFTLRARDLMSDLLCHLELEVPSGYGLHTYIEEMNLTGDEGSNSCKDYIQFARDVLSFTTYESNKFCGVRRRIDFKPESYDAFTGYRRTGNSQRYYVEEKDSEMDLWLQVARDRGTGSLASDRNITLVVTVFKKKCRTDTVRFDGTDYIKCPNTEQYCVRRDFLCDGHVNCAWPDGDVGTDEAHCDAQGRYVGPGSGAFGLSSSDDVVTASNIPIIIIVIIMIIGICLVFFIALRHVCRGLKASEERPVTSDVRGTEAAGVSGGRGNRRRRSQEDEDISSAPPLLRQGDSRGREGERAIPSAPPTYEEVVKIVDGMPTVVVDSEMPPNPPPYTETAESNL
jgi:hypothetical protein